MIVRNFEYLIALGREMHFARAAEACGVSQPTLSAGIKQLEEDLGALLVKRGQRLEGFTPEGERALAGARQMLADCERLRRELKHLREDMAGPLRIGVLAATEPVLGGLAMAFGERYPRAEISLHTAGRERLLDGVVAGEFDVAMSYLEEAEAAGMRQYPLYRERYLVFAPAEMELPAGDVLGWEEVAGLPLCLLSAGAGYGFPAARAGDGRRMLCDSPEMLAAYVRSGRWATVATQTLGSMFEGRLVAVPVSRPKGESVGLVTAGREVMAPLVHAFLESVHDPAMVAEVRKKLAGAKRFRRARERDAVGAGRDS